MGLLHTFTGDLIEERAAAFFLIVFSLRLGHTRTAQYHINHGACEATHALQFRKSKNAINDHRHPPRAARHAETNSKSQVVKK